MATTSIAPPLTQKVVVVNGSAEALSVLETLLDAGHYDMVFVESSDRAYSTIKRVQPNLIVLCTGVEALDGVQLLTMLKLDAATRDIPVLSYTGEDESQTRRCHRTSLTSREPRQTGNEDG
jgi:CheY-like chemotaxis protein